MCEKCLDSQTSTKEIFTERNTEELVHNLALMIYRYNETESVKATLYEIYHHSIHNRVSIAKDYLLMFRIHEKVSSLDEAIKALYNRTLV